MNLEDFTRHFAAQFDETAPGTITAETSFRDIAEWSSLVALSIIAMVDEEYGVKLTGEDIRTSNTVQEIYHKVAAKA